MTFPSKESIFLIKSKGLVNIMKIEGKFMTLNLPIQMVSWVVVHAATSYKLPSHCVHAEV